MSNTIKTTEIQMSNTNNLVFKSEQQKSEFDRIINNMGKSTTVTQHDNGSIFLDKGFSVTEITAEGKLYSY